MINTIETLKADVLVVGGGGAACRAALEAEMAGAKVILAVKGSFGGIGVRGSGSTAGGVSDRGGVAYPGIPAIQGFASKQAPLLKPEQDYANILQLGLGMTDRKLALILAEQAHDVMRPLLEDWSGEIIPRQWGMKSHGIPIMFGLTRMIRRSNIQVMDHTMVIDVLLEHGRIAGAIVIDEDSGKLRVIKTGAVILGTGGKGNLFKHSLTSACTTGDGYAMAYKAGAELMNFEFKQIFPGIIYPTINHFSAWFFVPHVKIKNALGEEYIHNYLPDGITVEDVYKQRGTHGPFSARDSASKYFDVSTIIETKEGRANEHDALYVDLTDPRVVDPLVKARREYFYYRGIRYLEEPIEFNICFHCSNGGVLINENGESCIEGLYAAGETASGPHGANRMAGHMLTSSQVFGKIAGRHAASKTAGQKISEPKESAIKEALDNINALSKMRKNEKPSTVKKDLQRLTWETMLVHVNEDLLNQALRDIGDIKENRLSSLNIETTQDMIDALELRNLVLAGEILAKTTRMRKESRGDLYREDYPDRDDLNWSKVIKVKRKDARMHLWTEVIDPDWSERPGDMLGIRWG
jgi:succinate dehydrogenase/fumarate reductase flavoprotein subunit